MNSNREIAGIFRKLALILEIKEVEWKPRAYRNAAYGIEDLGKEVDDIYEEEGLKGLEEISGVGESIAKHIEEFIKTGKIKKFEKLRKEYPENITELEDLEGLGPKKVKKLIKELNIKSDKGLKKAAEKHKIRNIEGFGEKTEENILDALQVQKAGKERMLINKAISIAEEIVRYIKDNSKVEKIDYVGSLRRMKETIGDIDILVAAKDSEDVMKAFTSMKGIKRVISKGKTRSSVMLKEDNVHVDLRVIKKSSYAAAMQYFTGSKEHNIETRKIALKKNYKLSEYGLFKKKSGRKIHCVDESTLYKKLGMDYVPPELRENRGEFEAAKKHKIPELVETKDIKGDLHMHTTFSDGAESIKKMVEAAEDKGYKYIAITDHSKSARIAGGMDIKEIKKQWKEIDRISDRHKIKILKGSEVDILKDGSLDYPDEILKELDIVLGALHSNLKMTEKKMTERILNALDNRYLDILVHPSARLIGRRKPVSADWQKVFKKAAEKNKVMEINSQPERLDLDDSDIIAAKKKKVLFSIATDASDISDLDNMRLGIGQARRGWLEKKDVVNTYTFRQLKKIFRRM